MADFTLASLAKIIRETIETYKSDMDILSQNVAWEK